MLCGSQFGKHNQRMANWVGIRRFKQRDQQFKRGEAQLLFVRTFKRQTILILTYDQAQRLLMLQPLLRFIDNISEVVKKRSLYVVEPSSIWGLSLKKTVEHSPGQPDATTACQNLKQMMLLSPGPPNCRMN